MIFDTPWLSFYCFPRYLFIYHWRSDRKMYLLSIVRQYHRRGEIFEVRGQNLPFKNFHEIYRKFTQNFPKHCGSVGSISETVCVGGGGGRMNFKYNSNTFKDLIGNVLCDLERNLRRRRNQFI